jgi:hypothetical protein
LNDFIFILSASFLNWPKIPVLDFGIVGSIHQKGYWAKAIGLPAIDLPCDLIGDGPEPLAFRRIDGFHPADSPVQMRSKEGMGGSVLSLGVSVELY